MSILKNILTFTICILVISCGNYLTDEIYQVKLFNMKGAIETSGLLRIPSKLGKNYTGDCVWEEKNKKTTQCYAQMDKSNFYIDFNPGVDDANLVLNGNIEGNKVVGNVEAHSFAGPTIIGRFNIQSINNEN